MKLTCPKCQARLNIPARHVPQNAAWARCPRCHDRFFIPAPDHNPLNLGDGPAQSSSACGLAPPSSACGLAPPSSAYVLSRKRSPETQRLLARLTARRVGENAAENTDYDLNLITVYPQAAAAPMFYRLSVGLLLLMPIFLIGAAFKSSSAVPLADAGESAPTARPGAGRDDEGLIRDDLIGLRRAIILRGAFKTGVSHSGSESRVFKYYMTRLAPEACREISYLEIQSSRPAEGFTAVATCLENSGRQVEMKVRWPDRTAVITFPGCPGQEELELFPAPAAVATQVSAG